MKRIFNNNLNDRGEISLIHYIFLLIIFYFIIYITIIIFTAMITPRSDSFLIPFDITSTEFYKLFTRIILITFPPAIVWYNVKIKNNPFLKIFILVKNLITKLILFIFRNRILLIISKIITIIIIWFLIAFISGNFLKLFIDDNRSTEYFIIHMILILGIPLIMSKKYKIFKHVLLFSVVFLLLYYITR